MEPLISVIVPVYNVARYLDKCIGSIVSQTYKNLEIFLIDDGSSDDSPEICDKWSHRDSRVKVIHKINEGVATARNTALNIANGEYIAFVDGDDYCFKNLYSILVKNALETEADISMCGYYESDTEIDYIELKNSGYSEKKSSDVLPNICIGDYEFGVLWNKLYKRSVVEGIEMPQLKCSQDLPYNYFAFKKATKIVISDEQLYFYRNRNTSTTKSNFKFGAFDAIKAKEIILSNEEKNPMLLPYAIKGFVNSNFVVLSGVISNNMFMDKFDDLRNSILKFKKEIFFSKQYLIYDKVKTLILWLFPKLFIRLIGRR